MIYATNQHFMNQTSITSVSSKSSEIVKDRDCRTRFQGHGRQDCSGATEQIVLIIWEMWSPLVGTFSFGEERAREISGKTEVLCKRSCRSLRVSLYPPAVCCFNQWSSDSHPVLLLLGCHSTAYWWEFGAAQPSTFSSAAGVRPSVQFISKNGTLWGVNLRRGLGKRP